MSITRKILTKNRNKPNASEKKMLASKRCWIPTRPSAANEWRDVSPAAAGRNLGWKVEGTASRKAGSPRLACGRNDAMGFDDAAREILRLATLDTCITPAEDG